MTIEVKGTKTQAQDADPAQRYLLKNADRRSKTPAILGVFLMGIALYLKSVFPSSADPDETKPSSKKEPDGKEGPKLVQAQPAERPPLDDNPTGTVAKPEGPVGGGGRLVDLMPLAEFISIQSPVVENFRLPGPDGWWKEFQPLDLEAPPANDNSGGTGTPGPESPGSDPGGGVDEDPDDNGPGGPEDEEEPPQCDGGGDNEPCGEDPDCQACDDDDPCDGKPLTPNRAPRISGPVYLMDVTGCGILAIGLPDLLRNAVDPDGDTLAVENLSVSSGTLSQSADGWVFQPQMLGPVTVTYEITDGEFVVEQTAQFSVIRSVIGGTGGDDALLGTMCADDMDGGCGDDNMDGRGGNDVLNGGSGNDHIVAGSGDDIVFGGIGDDIIFGGSGDDHISGGTGNDRLFGEDGDDMIFGNAGNDTLTGGRGSDLLSGGDGNDSVKGDAGNDTISGGNGDDVLSGGSGKDTIDGGNGNDRVNGGDGNDTVHDGFGEDVVRAGTGDDTVVASPDGDDDVYDGGEGVDILDYSLATLKVMVDLAAGTATGTQTGKDTVSSFEAVTGGRGDDELAGTDCENLLQGNDGADLLHGRGGDDTLSDGQGSDTVFGGSGNDRIVAALDGENDVYDGGAGCDTLDYSATTAGVMIDLMTGTAYGVEIGGDSISGFETVVGGQGDDHLISGGSPTVMIGGEGENTFEFLPTQTSGTIEPVIHEIMDFKVGDRIRMSKYDLFEEVLDEMEERFEDIYGDSFDDDDAPIRVSHGWVEDMKRTVVEADFNRDDVYETTITMQGHHVLVIVENV